MTVRVLRRLAMWLVLIAAASCVLAALPPRAAAELATTLALAGGGFYGALRTVSGRAKTSAHAADAPTFAVLRSAIPLTDAELARYFDVSADQVRAWYAGHPMPPYPMRAARRLAAVSVAVRRQWPASNAAGWLRRLLRAREARRLARRFALSHVDGARSHIPLEATRRARRPRDGIAQHDRWRTRVQSRRWLPRWLRRGGRG